MNVAVVAGICVDHDAISASVIEQASILAGLEGVDDVVVMAQYHDRPRWSSQVTVLDPWSLVRALAEARIDLVIFHWGIEYALFDALPLVASRCRTVVYFHNLTSANWVSASQQHLIERSMRQIQLPALTGTPFWTPSRFNIETLCDWGYAPDHVRLLPFPIERPSITRRTYDPSERVRFLTVGRIVPAKGVHVLIDATRRVALELGGEVSVDIVGSAQLSDSQYIIDLRSSIAAAGLGGVVKIHLDTSDAALVRAYRRSDVVVCPSFHEGLCVPVVEAYRADCRVIGTTAGNLPFIVQPPDPTVPPGDSEALAEAMITVGRELLDGSSRPPPGAHAVIDTYSRVNAIKSLRAALNDLGNPMRQENSLWTS